MEIFSSTGTMIQPHMPAENSCWCVCVLSTSFFFCYRKMAVPADKPWPTQCPLSLLTSHTGTTGSSECSEQI